MRTSLIVVLGGATLMGAVIVTSGQHVDPNTLPEPGATPAAAPKKNAYVKPATTVPPKAPPGFTVSLLTDGLPAGARWMTMAPNGDIFVSGYISNTIMMLRDGSKDGRYNTKFVFLPTGRAAPGNPTGGRGTPRGNNQQQPSGRGGGRGGNNFMPAQAAPARGPAAPAAGGARAGAPSPWTINPTTGLPQGDAGTRAAALACNASPAAVTGSDKPRNPMGMAFLGEYMYVANTDSIIRYKYAAGDNQAPADIGERIAILPSGGVNNQRNIVFNRAGTKMYVSIGSNSNNNAGEDCRRASIMEFNPDGTGGRIYASGLRNPLALAWQPVPAGAPEILWATVTERNGFGDDLVPDFATALTDGGFYGWPYAYIGKHYDPKYLGGQTALVNKTLVPDIVVPAHSAPSGLAFYTPRTPAPAKQYPSQYWGLFLTLSGSADNSSVARGFKVVFVPFEYNQQTQQSKPKASAMVDFVTGFVSNDGAARGAPINFWGRPTALLIGSDGSLLVLDEADPSNPNVNSSKIWKVTYNPPVAPTP